MVRKDPCTSTYEIDRDWSWLAVETIVGSSAVSE